MAAAFPLAGLLRVRRIQQERAASELAVANARLREHTVRQVRARDELGATMSEVSDTSSMHAVAAARATAGGLLGDLESLRVLSEEEADRSRQQYTDARTRSRGLEKLEDRHFDAQNARELHAQQLALDELASIRWHKKTEGGT